VKRRSELQSAPRLSGKRCSSAHRATTIGTRIRRHARGADGNFLPLRGALLTLLTIATFLTIVLIGTDAPGAAASSGRTGRQEPSAAAEDPDRLYDGRDSLPNAEHAAALWERRLHDDPRAFEAAWKLSRACYWLGGHVAPDERRRQYERGVDAGRRATAIAPGSPEGHFWMAANMGALAESFGMRAGLRYRGPIKEALEKVLKIDPAFQHGSADRALGRWYQRVPGLFGGSKRKSLEHLQRSLTYNPDSTISNFFLAETLIDMDRDAEAKAALQKVLDAPIDSEWAPEDREFKEKARVRLQELSRQ